MPSGGPPIAKSEQTAAQRVRDLLESALEDWREDHERMRAHRKFCFELDHYKGPDDPDVKDNRRIMPRGRELYSKVRHKVGEITKDFHYEVIPTDNETDPMAADAAKALLDTDLQDECKEFDTTVERMVMDGLGSAMGVIAIDYEAAIGPNGSFLFRNMDSTYLIWDRGWQSPHDPSCPWVMEIRWPKLREIVRMGEGKNGWKQTDKVRPDGGPGQFTKTSSTEDLQPGQTRLGSGDNEPVDLDQKATICLLYERNLTETEKSDAYKQDLPKADRYHLCTTCGHQDTSQDGATLPEVGPPCPHCALHGTQDEETGEPPMMQRVDEEELTDETLLYQGMKLTIAAPYSDATHYEGEAPFHARSVPYIVFKGYDHPINPVGMSDTALDRSMQLMSNATLRLGYEQMARSKPIIITPVDGLEDAKGEPWQFTDSYGVAYWNAAGPPSTQFFQGNGLPPSWTQWFSALQNVFTRDMGTSDIAFGSEMSKDVPVGTIDAIQKSGEVPVEHHKKKLWRALSIGLSVLLDMKREAMTEQEMVRRRGPQGQYDFQLLRGANVPNADIRVSAAPQMGDVDPQEVTATMQVFAAPPPMRMFLARKYNVPRADLDAYNKEDADWQAFQQFKAAQAQAKAQGPPMPSGAPGGMPGGPMDQGGAAPMGSPAQAA